MTSFSFFFGLLTTMAIPATGFPANTNLHKMTMYRPTIAMYSHGPSREGQGHMAVRASEGSALPAFVVAASVFALPVAAPADVTFVADSSLISANVQQPRSSVACVIPAPSASSIQLSTSSLSTPIGEVQDGSETSLGTSFGQWFFLIYVVVSLLAGGKEMLVRIQKQIDKDSD
ncbi:hypothetical protein ACHAWF_016305 [Thalassiosira exigua]